MTEQTTANVGVARQRRSYDETFKRDVVRLWLESGRPRAQVARDLGVSPETGYGAEGTAVSRGTAAIPANGGRSCPVAAMAEIVRLSAALKHMTRQCDNSQWL